MPSPVRVARQYVLTAHYRVLRALTRRSQTVGFQFSLKMPWHLGAYGIRQLLPSLAARALQVFEALKQSLQEAIEAPEHPGRSPALYGLPSASADQASVPEATGEGGLTAASSRIRWGGHAPPSGSEVCGCCCIRRFRVGILFDTKQLTNVGRLWPPN